MATKVDLLLVNQIDGSQTGGFTGYEADRPTYIRTIAPTYLRSHFYHTFCAEAANCMQLAAAARAAGLSVKVLDGMLLDLTMEGMYECIREYEAEVYAFSLFHSSYTAVLDLITPLRERCPDATIVTGGNYATLVYREILARVPQVDYVLVGEADHSLPDLCQRVISRQSVTSVPGIAYRETRASDSPGERSDVKLTPPEVPDINEVLPLARDYAPEILGNEFSFSMISSRGCGLGVCTFCYLPEYQKVSNIPRWRGKSPERIVEEMEYLRDTYGVDHVTFVDEDFIGPKRVGTERIVKFAELLIERKTNMTWYANALVLSVFHLEKMGHIELLASSGLRYLFVGIESGSDHILRRFKKGFKIAKLKEVIAALGKHGIRINPGIITFLPEHAPDEVKANIDIVRLIDYYDVFVFTRRLVMLPGTEEGCGCSATDATGEVESTWELPDEDYAKKLAIDVDIDPNEYFKHQETRLLYVGMCRYRDEAFELYERLIADKGVLSDEQRRALTDLHFQFFYELYDAVMSGHIASFHAAASFADVRFSRPQDGLHGTAGPRATAFVPLK